MNRVNVLGVGVSVLNRDTAVAAMADAIRVAAQRATSASPASTASWRRRTTRRSAKS